MSTPSSTQVLRDGGRARPSARLDRAVWALVFVAAGITLGLSCWLSPSPSGMGTHQQLGLPPCGMVMMFGVPCPACGLTTAFAHLAHLELEASLRANPMGLPLFLATCVVLPLSALGLLRGASVSRVVDAVRADKVAIVFVLALLASWTARLLST